MSRIYDDDVLEQLALLIQAELTAKKVDTESATLISVEITQRIRFLLGGQVIYFKKNPPHKRNERDETIFAAFDGTNYQALSMQYQLSEMRVRQIIETRREKDRRRY